MQSVWKVPVPVRNTSYPLAVPGSARLVRVETEATDPGVVLTWWYVNDVEAPSLERPVIVLGTGMQAPREWVYLASCAPHPRTGLVWHLWEVHDAG